MRSWSAPCFRCGQLADYPQHPLCRNMQHSLYIDSTGAPASAMKYPVASMPTMTTSAMRLSDRVNNLKPSATLAVTAKVAQLKAQGVNVIGFGAGEPDFDTPANIKQASIAALNAGKTKYAATEGELSARQAI